MKLTSIFLTVCTSFFLLCACERDNLPNQNLHSEETVSGNGIDVSVFSHLGSEVIAAVQALSRADLPVGLTNIAITPSTQEINKYGEERVVSITGTFPHEVEIVFYEFLNPNNILASTTLTLPSGGGTVSSVVSFDPFYDVDPYNARLIHVTYQVAGDPEIGHLEIYHQYPVGALFVTDLRTKDYTLKQEGDIITVTKTGEFPNQDGQIVNFRVRPTNGSTDLATGIIYLASVREIEMTIPPLMKPE